MSQTEHVDARLADTHHRGDRVTIKCARCGRVGEHEVRGRLEGLAARRPGNGGP